MIQCYSGGIISQIATWKQELINSQDQARRGLESLTPLSASQELKPLNTAAPPMIQCYSGGIISQIATWKQELINSQDQARRGLESLTPLSASQELKPLNTAAPPMIQCYSGGIIQFSNNDLLGNKAMDSY